MSTGILLDGQVSQGKYDGSRLPFAPDFTARQRKQNETGLNASCHFCRDTHPDVRITRKRQQRTPRIP